MQKYFYNEVKNFKGNLLTLGIEDEIVNKFTKNNKKINVYSISKNSSIGVFKKSKRKSSTGKKIDLKKLRKYFNKKSIDYMICNIEEINEYIKYFVKDSIYLNSNKLYIYIDSDEIDIDSILKKYKRYNCEIEIKEYKKYKILIIDNSNSKNKFFMDKIYFIKDTLLNLVDFIGNILVS